jgi:arginine deiminase
VRKLPELEITVQELERKIQRKIEVKESEETEELTSILMNEQFKEYKDDQEKLLHELREEQILTRISIFSTKHKLPLTKAKELFFRAFPEFKDKLEL